MGFLKNQTLESGSWLNRKKWGKKAEKEENPNLTETSSEWSSFLSSIKLFLVSHRWNYSESNKWRRRLASEYRNETVRWISRSRNCSYWWCKWLKRSLRCSNTIYRHLSSFQEDKYVFTFSDFRVIIIITFLNFSFTPVYFIYSFKLNPEVIYLSKKTKISLLVQGSMKHQLKEQEQTVKITKNQTFKDVRS